MKMSPSDRQTCHWIAQVANFASSQSRLGGAPRLRYDSSLRTLIKWILWNDRNAETDGWTIPDAWHAIDTMIGDYVDDYRESQP